MVRRQREVTAGPGFTVEVVCTNELCGHRQEHWSKLEVAVCVRCGHPWEWQRPVPKVVQLGRTT